MMRIKGGIFAFFALFVFQGCQESENRLADKAKIESEVAAKNQVQAENENLAKRAQDMEADLAQRNRFYQMISGSYSGAYDNPSENGKSQTNIRILISSSLPAYPVSRVRTLEEISYELNNLYLNVYLVKWDSQSELTSDGCVFEKIKPDLTRGELNLVSANCSTVYRLNLIPNEISTAPALLGQMYSIKSSQVRQFTVSKTQE